MRIHVCYPHPGAPWHWSTTTHTVVDQLCDDDSCPHPKCDFEVYDRLAEMICERGSIWTDRNRADFSDLLVKTLGSPDQ